MNVDVLDSEVAVFSHNVNCYNMTESQLCCRHYWFGGGMVMGFYKCRQHCAWFIAFHLEMWKGLAVSLGSLVEP